MKILLAGATGFLGFRTLEKLAELPYIDSIISIGRVLVPERTLIHPKVKYVLGNLEDSNFVNNVVKDVDVIINAASLSSPWGKREDFELANVTTQLNLIKAGKECGLKRFIYVSSPSIYFNGQDRLLVKESDPLPKTFINEYARTKREAEILLEYSSMDFVILRPRALIGRCDSVIMPRLIKAHSEGKLKIIGNGRNIVDLTSVENVVDSIILSISTIKGLNQIYNITNGAPVNLWENIELVLSLLGEKLNRNKVPYFIAKTAAHAMEFKAKITDYQEPTLTVYGIGNLATSMTLDITMAKTFLDYTPKVSLLQSTHEFVNWYKSK